MRRRCPRWSLSGEHEGAFTASSVRDASRKQRSEQLPEHNGRGNHGGHESGEVEGGDEEEERARDRAQVVTVDQADDRSRDGDEDVEPRYTPPACCPFFHGKPSFPRGPILDAGIVA